MYNSQVISDDDISGSSKLKKIELLVFRIIDVNPFLLVRLSLYLLPCVLMSVVLINSPIITLSPMFLHPILRPFLVTSVFPFLSQSFITRPDS